LPMKATTMAAAASKRDIGVRFSLSLRHSNIPWHLNSAPDAGVPFCGERFSAGLVPKPARSGPLVGAPLAALALARGLELGDEARLLVFVKGAGNLAHYLARRVAAVREIVAVGSQH
jgi:hypothetical protein